MSIDVSDIPSLREALRTGRKAVEAHIFAMEDAGSSWREETASEILWISSAPFVRFADFNRFQESRLGADWLWWWVDSAGECFGMLVQAKRYFRRNEHWELNFIGGPDGRQLENLVRSAESLGVSPNYVLFRGSLLDIERACGRSHPDHPFHCQNGSVSILPALEAQHYSWHSKRDAGNMALQGAVPLDTLAYTSQEEGAVFDVNLNEISDELRQLLTDAQSGARFVAKEIFRVLANSRSMAFTAASPTPIDIETAVPVFKEMPDDYGHFMDSYYPNVFRGLRRELPSYVESAVQTGVPPAFFPSSVRGIVVISM